MEKMLFTGASGFLGQIILPILARQYAVTTCGRSAGNNIVADLAHQVPAVVGRYDIVLHAAAKAHTYPQTEAEVQEYFDMNVRGTQHLCTALEKAGTPRTFIYVSTVAVYGCITGRDITEDAPLNGTTPYALSKILAERYLTHWCESHGCNLVILRPSLLAGHNATANLRSMTRGIRRCMYADIDGGKAEKSILCAQDIARAIPYVANRSGVYNICDTTPITFRQLSVEIARQLNRPKPIIIPYKIASALAKIGDLFGDKAPINSLKLQKMVLPLTFSNAKLCALGWQPTDTLSHYEV